MQCLWSFYCTKSGETGDVVGMKNGTIFRAPLWSCRSRIQDKPARFLMKRPSHGSRLFSFTIGGSSSMPLGPIIVRFHGSEKWYFL